MRLQHRNRCLGWLGSVFVSISLQFSVLGADLNWAKVEMVLREINDGLAEPSLLLKAPDLQQANVRSNTRLFIEMAIQTEYPLVAVAGLAGLDKLDPTLAYKVAMERTWASTNIGSPIVLPFLIYLSNHVSLKVFTAAMSSVGAVPPGNYASAVLVIRVIPEHLLIDWLRTPERFRTSVSLEALIVDRFMSVNDTLVNADRAMVQKRFSELKSTPGLPTAVFLLHSDLHSDELLERLLNVLIDDAVDKSMKETILRKHAGQLYGRLSLKELPIPEKARIRYEKLIEKYGKKL